MSDFEDDLILAARRLLARRPAQRGRLPAARIRISTTYYALFHFILGQVGDRVVGTGHDLRRRRRLITRTVSHKSARLAMIKVRGRRVDATVADLFAPDDTPEFIRDLAAVFIDAQDKRIDADYDLDEDLTERDARLLLARVRRAMASWRAAKGPINRDFKHALGLLILIKGSLRAEP